MQELPLEVIMRDIEATDAIKAKIRKKADKLHKLYDRITYCRVAIAALQKNKHQGKEFQVNIELDLPGKVLVVSNQSHRHEDLYVAIRDSFKVMQRQLEEYLEKMRGFTKKHDPQLTGKIVRLFDGYGFIETANGNEYYFHQTNLNQADFSDLNVGIAVQFVEVITGDSLQAHQITLNR